MATEHDTLIEKLIALGSHLEHPDAKALWNKLKGVVEAEVSTAFKEFPKLLYHASDSARKPLQRVVNSAEEEAAAKLEGFLPHPSLRSSPDAAEPSKPFDPSNASGPDGNVLPSAPNA